MHINTVLDSVEQERAMEAITAPGQSSSPSDEQGDILAITFMLLMEASTISSHTAQIHAKQLEQNALSQQRLNAQEQHDHFSEIPSKIIDHHTQVYHTQHSSCRHQRQRPTGTGWWWSWNRFQGGDWRRRWVTTRRVSHNTCPNQGAIDQANARNQEISADRMRLADQLSILQQGANIGEAQVNTISNEAMQTAQEGSNLLQILQSLTFKALLRSPPN